jgi:hypothetical protein
VVIRESLSAAIWNPKRIRSQDLKTRIFSADQKRNKLIHSLWVEGDAGTALRLKLLAKGEHKLTAEQHTKDQLIEVANELTQLTYDVTKFTVSTLFRHVYRRSSWISSAPCRRKHARQCALALPVARSAGGLAGWTASGSLA